jgi:hypothetical protein
VGFHAPARLAASKPRKSRRRRSRTRSANSGSKPLIASAASCSTTTGTTSCMSARKRRPRRCSNAVPRASWGRRSPRSSQDPGVHRTGLRPAPHHGGLLPEGKHRDLLVCAHERRPRRLGRLVFPVPVPAAEESVKLGHKYTVPVYPCLSKSRLGDEEALRVRVSLECCRYRGAAKAERARFTDELYLNYLGGRRSWNPGEVISEFDVTVRCLH